MLRAVKDIKFINHCRQLRLRFWECPPILYLLLGFVTIISMIAISLLASHYFEDPEVPRIIGVTVVTIIYLVLGQLIITSFNKISEANIIKTQFISIASHQLRSPLSVLSWTLEVLERDFKSADTDVHTPSTTLKNFLGTIHTNTQRMIDLVNQLIEVNRIDSESFMLHPEALAIEEITDTIVKEFRQYAKASNIEFGWNLPENIPRVWADRSHITIVIKNLLDNAIRYTASSGKITITIAPKKGGVVWSIQDTGIGIPENQKKFIFQQFFQASNRKQAPNQTRGSGLGLHVVRRIIEKMGGAVGFSTEENKGSLFWFTLPLATRPLKKS